MKKEIQNCELIELYRFLGKRWTVEILHNINEQGVSFNELKKKSNALISPILLSNRLKTLVKFKIIKKTKVEKTKYFLTRQGTELKEIMHTLKAWSIKADFSLPDICKDGKCQCEIVFDTT